MIPDLDTLRGLSSQAQAILYEDGGGKGIRADWRQRVNTRDHE